MRWAVIILVLISHSASAQIGGENGRTRLETVQERESNELEEKRKKADELYNAALFAEALPLYEQLLANDPRNLDLNERYQFCLKQKENPTISREDFIREKLAKNENDAHLIFELAKIKESQEEYAEALDLYEKCKYLCSKEKAKEIGLKFRLKQCKKKLKA